MDYIWRIDSEEKTLRQIAGALEQGIEKGMKQGLEKGLEKGRELERTTIATNLLHLGLSVKDIAAATSLSVKEIEDLAAKQISC